jgi:hypothetical protein
MQVGTDILAMASDDIFVSTRQSKSRSLGSETIKKGILKEQTLACFYARLDQHHYKEISANLLQMEPFGGTNSIPKAPIGRNSVKCLKCDLFFVVGLLTYTYTCECSRDLTILPTCTKLTLVRDCSISPIIQVVKYDLGQQFFQIFMEVI